MPFFTLLAVTLAAAPLTEAQTEHLYTLALSCVQREYPNKLAHVLASPVDAQTPKTLTPAFYGCYDWHSAVHGHWLLARLRRRAPHARASEALSALQTNITTATITQELRYLTAEGRNTFERPYGLAWLLALHAELGLSPETTSSAQTLEPLALEANRRLLTWLPKLHRPVRTGEHSQTAFALGLAIDAALTRGDEASVAALKAQAHRLYGTDTQCPLAYEPSGEDFLSPCLAEADLFRRVLPPTLFATFLTRLLPTLNGRVFTGVAPLAVVTNRDDGKLVHLDGLNLSRAWMLNGIAGGLPQKDPRRVVLQSLAEGHAKPGLEAVLAPSYEGTHWLGTFATYLLTAE
jgi:hypothetical protein